MVSPPTKRDGYVTLGEGEAMNEGHRPPNTRRTVFGPGEVIHRTRQLLRSTVLSSLLCGALIALIPWSVSTAAGQDFYLGSCTARVSGFEDWGLATASTRNLTQYSNETCLAVQARVSSSSICCNYTGESPWVWGSYVKVSAPNNTLNPFDDQDWRRASGRTYMGSNWYSNWATIYR